jgi:hypothetical protein
MIGHHDAEHVGGRGNIAAVFPRMPLELSSGLRSAPLWTDEEVAQFAEKFAIGANGAARKPAHSRHIPAARGCRGVMTPPIF